MRATVKVVEGLTHRVATCQVDGCGWTRRHSMRTPKVALEDEARYHRQHHASEVLVLTRTHNTTGGRLVDHPANVREARQRIAWSCTDNCGMTRKEASAAADALAGVDKPLVVGPYTFLLTREKASR